MLKKSPQNLSFHEQWSNLKQVGDEIGPHGDFLLRKRAPSPLAAKPTSTTLFASSPSLARANNGIETEKEGNSWWRMTRVCCIDQHALVCNVKSTSTCCDCYKPL
jgi:hypothetical protein